MVDGNPKSTAQIAGHPIHPMLVPFPIAFLVATFFCDLVFWRSGNGSWALGGMWLLGAGIVMALVAALAGFTDFFGERRIRQVPTAWYHMIGNLTAVVIAAINFIVRWQQGAETGVFPLGIWLSLIVVLLLLFNGWMGWKMVYRHRVGISDIP
jgi:uncharacterized membrane protein